MRELKSLLNDSLEFDKSICKIKDDSKIKDFN